MYPDLTHTHERNTVRDEDLEPIVLEALQRQFDLRAESANIVEERRQRQQAKAEEAEKRLREMRGSLKKLQEDEMEAFESYKEGITDKETFLQQKAVYEQMEARLNGNIKKQTEAVRALEDELDAMPEGLGTDQGIIQADRLTREMVEAFVEKIIVKPGNQVETEWKFKR